MPAQMTSLAVFSPEGKGEVRRASPSPSVQGKRARLAARASSRACNPVDVELGVVERAFGLVFLTVTAGNRTEQVNDTVLTVAAQVHLHISRSTACSSGSRLQAARSS